MAFSIEITKVAPVYKVGVNIQWEVTDPPDLIGVYEYRLDRSGSPAGPWETVVEDDDIVLYTDTDANLDGLTRDFYYRITVTSPSAVEVSSDPHNITDKLVAGAAGNHLLRRRKMRTDLLRTLQKFSGNEYYVLKRKHWGERCDNCWDSTTKSIVIDRCDTCLGVGYTAGYFDPYALWGRLDPPNTSAPLQMEGLADQRMFRFTSLDFPILEPDDVLVNKRSDRRFVVHTHSQTEMKLVSVHQEVTVAELPREHNVYQIEMP